MGSLFSSPDKPEPVSKLTPINMAMPAMPGVKLSPLASVPSLPTPQPPQRGGSISGNSSSSLLAILQKLGAR